MEYVQDLHSDTEPQLPFLKQMVTTPSVHPEQRANLHARLSPSAMLYVPDPSFMMPEFPPKPTAKDVKGAITLIDDLLQDFTFKFADAGRAHSYALALLPLVRSMINGPTPMAWSRRRKRARARVYSCMSTIDHVGRTGGLDIPARYRA